MIINFKLINIFKVNLINMLILRKKLKNGKIHFK